MTREELTVWTLFAAAALEPSSVDTDGNEVSNEKTASVAGNLADLMLDEWRERERQVKP